MVIRYSGVQEVSAVAEAPRLLTVKDVADRLQVPEDTVRVWLRQGRLRGIRPGGKKTGWRVTESDLGQFLDQRSNQGPAQQRLPTA